MPTAELIDPFRDGSAQAGPQSRPEPKATVGAPSGLIDPFVDGSFNPGMVRQAFDDLQQSDPLPEQPGMWERAVTGARDYFTGANADPAVKDMREFQAGDMAGIWDGGAKLAFRQLLASTEEGKANAIKALYPDVEILQDTHGNFVVSLPNGQQRVINRPGPSQQDAYQFVTDALAFLGPSKLAGKAPTVVGRAGSEAGMVGSIEYGRSALSPDEDASLDRAVMAGAGGALGEVVSSALKRFLTRNTTTVQDRQGNLRQAAKEAAEKAGLKSEDITNAPEFVREWERAAADHGVSPETARKALFDEFGIDASTGQITGDVAQLRKEDGMLSGGRGEGAQRAMSDLKVRQGQQVENAADSLSGRLGPPIAQSPTEAGQVVTSGLHGAERRLSGQISNAYQNVPRGELWIAKEHLQKLPGGIRKRLDDEGNIDLSPGGLELLPHTRQALAQLDELPGNRPHDLPSDAQVFAHDVHALEKQRRRLNSLMNGATAPEDRRALLLVKRYYDEAIDDFVDNGLFSGDASVLTRLQDARALRTRYGELFAPRGKHDDAGRVVQRILDEERTAEEVGSYLTLSANISSQSMGRSVRLARRLSKVFGADSGEMNAVRSAVFQSVVRDAKGTAKGYKRLAQDLRGFANSTLAGALYTAPQRQEIVRLSQAVGNLVPPDGARNHSRSAGAFLGMVRDMLPHLSFFSGMATGDPLIALSGAAANATGRGVGEVRRRASAAQAASGSLPTRQRSYPLVTASGAAAGASRE